MAQQKIILNADPDRIRRRVRSQLLRAATLDVVEAESVQQVITGLTSYLPAVAVLSTRLAEYSELCRRLKNDPATAHIPLLLLDTEPRPNNSASDNIDGYLVEPVADAELLAYVRLLLNASGQNLRSALFESAPVDTQFIQRKRQVLRKMSFVASGIVVLIAALALAGWVFDVPILTSWGVGSVFMKVNTALALLCAGVSLALQREEHGTRLMTGKFFAAVTTIIALLTLLEYLAGINLGIDDLLVAVPADKSLGPFPLRMSPVSALCLSCFGIALLTLDGKKWRNHLVQTVTLAALTATVVGLVGFFYDVAALRRIGLYTSLALPTALCYALLGVGIFMARPEHGPPAILTRDTAGSVLARRLLAAAIVLPLILGWLHLRGEQLGYFELPFGAALYATVIMFIFVALIWWTAISLDRADMERRRNARASAQLASIVSSSADAILSNTLDGNITSWNLGAERMFGYTAEEMIGQPILRLFPAERHTEEEHIPTRQPTGENIERYETVLMAKDGRRLDVSLTISPIKDSAGKIIGMSQILRDITERKRTEEQVAQSQKIFYDLIEGAPFGIYVVDSQFRIAQMNAGAQGGAFRNVRPVIGRDFTEAMRILWPEPVAAEIIAVFRRTLKTGEPYYSPRFTHPRHDVEAVESYEWELHRIIMPDGQYGIICYYFDSTQLRQVEAALQQSREDLDRAQAVGQIGWWRLDVQRNVLTWSDENYRIFGVPQGTPLSYETFLGLVHPDDREYVETQWQAGLDGAPYDIEHRIVADGLVKWVHEKAYLEFDEAGKLQSGFGITQDITERKRVEQALHDSQERFRGIVESAMDAIIAVDAEHRVVLFNAAAEAMFRCSRNEALGASIDRFIPERSREAHRAHVRRFREYGTTARAMGQLGAISGLRADGEEFPIEASISQMTLGKEQIFTVILRDITGRKQAENALHESEQRFANFMQRLPGLAWIKDNEGRYVYVNDAAESAFRLPREALYGKTDEEVFPRETAEQFRENDRKALASEAGLVMIETLEHDDGILHHSLVSKFPIRDSNGLAKGTGGVAIDITERVQAEKQLQDATEKLREADRRKDEFLATLAHELRNPLAPIRNCLHVLQQAGNEGPVAERMRSMIERQVNHLIRLVDDLMEVSRISRGKIELKKERCDLVAILRHTLDTSQPLMQAGNHQLTVTLPSESVWLNADPVRLTQVFANLFNNAAKFTEAGGHIELTAERRDGEAVVSIRDSGMGIPDEMLLRVFDLFTQVKRNLGQAQGGLGIGLALARSLVEMHGGRIEAYSEGLGKGSEFVVHLPLDVLAPADTEESAVPSPKLLVRRRILVTDDNQDAADSLALLLQSLGNEVQVVYDGPAALKILATFKPAVVLLDIGMPEMDGYEVARRIRHHPDGRNILLIALTGWGQNEDRRRTREAGFDHHLVKPLNLQALIELLAELKN